jgi:hypothetical protein
MELVAAIKLNLSHEHVRTGDHSILILPSSICSMPKAAEILLFWEISGNHRMTGKKKNSGIPDEW